MLTLTLSPAFLICMMRGSGALERAGRLQGAEQAGPPEGAGVRGLGMRSAEAQMGDALQCLAGTQMGLWLQVGAVSLPVAQMPWKVGDGATGHGPVV